MRPSAARALDVAALASFVVIGRASHHHGETVTGLAGTSWPFAVGLVAGWGVLRLTGLAPGSVRAGIVVTSATVSVGMLLRAASGQGVAVAFVGVALVWFGSWLVAGRAVIAAAARRVAG